MACSMSSNPVYMTLLKVLPLILSATACVKSFGSEHRNGHDTISFVIPISPSRKTTSFSIWTAHRFA